MLTLGKDLKKEGREGLVARGRAEKAEWEERGNSGWSGRGNEMCRCASKWNFYLNKRYGHLLLLLLFCSLLMIYVYI